MKKINAILLLAIILILAGCSESADFINGIEQPEKISTSDEIYPAKNANSVEPSENVNGMRFTASLEDFSQSYNLLSSRLGETELINSKNWSRAGDTQTDANGISYDCYYYNGKNYTLTATVEAETQKLMNVGCATTMNIFVSQDENKAFSEVVLKKSAVAAAACGFSYDSIDILQDIFYRTTFENTDYLWYEGFVFNFGISENKADSDKTTVLFRVYPISDSLREKWNIEDYYTYISSQTTSSKNY